MSEVKDKINQIVSEFSEFGDPRINWEYLKFKMREVTRNKSIEVAKDHKEKGTNLASKVEKFFSMNELSIDETVECESAKQELDRIYDHIADGCILYSKALWYEEGEKASKYFLSLENRNKVISCIRRLRNPSDLDKDSSGPRKISEEQENFYGSLYRRTSVKTEGKCFQYLEKLNTPMFTPCEQSLYECKLTLQKCWEALTSMQNGKSPGNTTILNL